MSLFRKALRLEVASRGVKIIQGEPPPAVTSYRKSIMEIFCSASSGGCLYVRTLLLHMLPNGDWRNLSSIELYVGRLQVSADKALKMVMNGLVTAITACNPSILNYGRWHGNEQCVGQVGILEGVCNLGFTTYERFMD